MTIKELQQKLMEGCLSQDTKYMPTKEDITVLKNTCLEYTISFLEGMQPKWTSGDLFIQSQIEVLKSAIKPNQ